MVSQHGIEADRPGCWAQHCHLTICASISPGNYYLLPRVVCEKRTYVKHPAEHLPLLKRLKINDWFSNYYNKDMSSEYRWTALDETFGELDGFSWFSWFHIPSLLLSHLVELAMIMDRLYGGVCYAGIDTDPELKYPKGAGRVAFSNQQSYIAAISARFVQLQHGEIDKRVSRRLYSRKF